MLSPLIFGGVALTLLLTLPLPAASIPEKSLDFFEKKVRPILVQRCEECHGAEKQKGGLRLDHREAVLKGGDSGAAIIPGKPDESLLVKAISWSDSELQMPPKNRLPPAEEAILKQWVQEGAHDPRDRPGSSSLVKAMSLEEAKNFWAYRPITNALLPSVQDRHWRRNEIDDFILAGLERRKLKPAPPADRGVLLRRLYFDLWGLPPTPEAIARFSQEAGTNSWERTVDSLLAAPEFGERWARHWLDVARFGESVTLRGLIFKEAWRYRDYVISALNRDLPFDQFIREQIAGDLLPSTTLEQRQRQLVATSFLALGNANLEEQDKRQLRMDLVDEQLDTIGKAFLAQTIGCARCHDHKFDPIPTRDYYALAGILRNVKTSVDANVSSWIELPLPLDPQQEATYETQATQTAALQKKVKKLREEMAALETESGSLTGRIRLQDLPGVVIDDSRARQVGEWKHSQYSGKYLGDGYLHDSNTGKGSKTLTFQPENLAAGRYEIRLAFLASENRATKVPVTILSAEGDSTVVVNQRETPPIGQRFVSLGQFRFEANGQGYVLISNEGTDGHVVADAIQFLPLDGKDGPAADKALPQTDRKDESGRKKDLALEIRQTEEELKQLASSHPPRPMYQTVKEETEISDTHVHLRGSVHQLGEKVPRGFLQVASWKTETLPTQQSGRKELAEWLVDSRNPLTARVFVNRTWHWLFGQGLVRTVDNFGTTGEKPSHPELLDYLSAQFIREGWSVKKLIKKIVTSQTYQMASRGGAAAELDPENRLVGRANRRRLEGECLRDAILAVSGQLKTGTNGPGWAGNLTADFGYKSSSTRRSIYEPQFRNAPLEMVELFDMADPSVVTGARNASTVAPQALFLLNHPFILEQSSRAAERVISLRPDQRLEQAYLLALGRPPTPAEKTLLQNHLANLEGKSLVAGWAEIFQTLFASVDFRYLN